MAKVSNSIDFLFFFQAEDGIRDTSVTGVQACALPIYIRDVSVADVDDRANPGESAYVGYEMWVRNQIGRASCRERGWGSGGGGGVERKRGGRGGGRVTGRMRRGRGACGP